jgi:UDP-N-acetylmuramate dehydrogenase
VIASRRVSAGWLIDKLGLKGTKIGNAQISEQHGNFIVNLGGATASDVVQLAALVKTRARDRLGIQLQEEVQYL